MVTHPQPTANQVREELDRLLGDANFRRTPSHSHLLRYLFERKTVGDDGALCETDIAMAVLQRDPAFDDAELDPILRVSGGRLCARLDQHYQHFEPTTRRRSRCQKGATRPSFASVRQSRQQSAQHQLQRAARATSGTIMRDLRRKLGNRA